MLFVCVFRLQIFDPYMTVFRDSIHIGSISPSKIIHFGPSAEMLAWSRIITEKRPSFHSRVVGLMMPYNSSFVTAYKRVNKNRERS